jgi:uncharacterized UPF0160 family protein
VWSLFENCNDSHVKIFDKKRNPVFFYQNVVTFKKTEESVKQMTTKWTEEEPNEDTLNVFNKTDKMVKEGSFNNNEFLEEMLARLKKEACEEK